FDVSNYVNMGKFVLLEKGQDHEYEKRYPAQDDVTLAIHTMGRMPALETEHGFLTETCALLEYRDQVGERTALFPTDASPRARVKQLMHMVEVYIELPARRCYAEMFFGGKVSDETKAEVKEALTKGARALARVTDFRPWLAGEQLS